MTTFRDLLNSLKSLSESQLDQEVLIIPTGYCSAAPLEIDGYSSFNGSVGIDIAKGDIVFDEGSDSPQCGCGVSGCLDLGEVPEDVVETFEDAEIILKSGQPYIRIAE